MRIYCKVDKNGRSYQTVSAEDEFEAIWCLDKEMIDSAFGAMERRGLKPLYPDKKYDLPFGVYVVNAERYDITRDINHCKWDNINVEGVADHPQQTESCVDAVNHPRQTESCGGDDDKVNHPRHYASTCSLECIDVMEAIFGPEYTAAGCLMNAVKYLWRYKNKGKPEEDLQKAKWYLDYADGLITEDDYFEITEAFEKINRLYEKVVER